MAEDGPPIRPLARDHLDSWHTLQREGMADPFTRRSLARELDNPLARIHAILVGDRVVAAFLGWLVVDELQILQVVVAPDRRGQGLGQRLVEHALQRAKAAGATTATLEVRAANTPAIRLYERTGFVRDGLRKGFYPDGEDGVLMRGAIG